MNVKMKFYSILLIFLIFKLNLGFSQNPISEIKKARWNHDKEKWEFYEIESWDYDNTGREIFYSSKNNIISAFIQINDLSISTKYNNQGQIVRKEQSGNNYSTEFPYWSKENTDYTYDHTGRLIEEFVQIESIDNEGKSFRKTVVNHDEIGKQSNYKFYTKGNETDDWWLSYQRDSIYDNEKCLSKAILTYYHPNNGSFTISENRFGYQDNCVNNYSEYLNWNPVLNEFVPNYRLNIEFLDNGKKEVIRYDKFRQNEWEHHRIIEYSKNELDQIIKSLWITYQPSRVDSIMEINKYLPTGELEVKTRFQNSDGNNGFQLVKVRYDSFTYEYDQAGLLTKEIRYQSHNDGLFTTHTYMYDRFCNGQIKTEIRTIDSTNSIMNVYSYHNGADCPLENNQPNILVFPNPNDGFFNIQSNFFKDKNLDIRIFNLLGQEISFDIIEQLNYQYKIQIPKESKGQFFILISDGITKWTEKIIIH